MERKEELWRAYKESVVILQAEYLKNMDKLRASLKQIPESQKQKDGKYIVERIEAKMVEVENTYTEQMDKLTEEFTKEVFG